MGTPTIPGSQWESLACARTVFCRFGSWASRGAGSTEGVRQRCGPGGHGMGGTADSEARGGVGETMRAMARYDAACAALAAASKVDEAKSIRDKAEAMRVYARQAQNLEMEGQAIKIRLRAE